MVSGNEGEKTEFNFAISFLKRLDAFFWVADEAAIGLDSHAWFHALLVVRRELSPLMNPDELKLADEYKKQIHLKVAASRIRINRTGINEIPDDLYDLMDEFEIKMRSVLKRTGLLMKMQEDAMKALK